ncbi:MAG: aminotransferase class V-fold PLP-dependent enzyme, partial [Candidatus Thorarchaeota archaeon]
ADYLRKKLAENEIDFYTFESPHRSATVSCRPDDVDELIKSLTKERIICSVRNNRLRVSPHFYNTQEEIDKLIDHMG